MFLWVVGRGGEVFREELFGVGSGEVVKQVVLEYGLVLVVGSPWRFRCAKWSVMMRSIRLSSVW